MNFASPTIYALLLLASLLSAALSALATARADRPTTVREAPVVILDRTVATFRAPFLGALPDDRAQRARQTLAELFARGGPGEIAIHLDPQGIVMRVDAGFAMILLPEDADRLRVEALEGAAALTVDALRRVATGTRERRDRPFLLCGLAAAISATAALALLTAGVLRAWRALPTRARTPIIVRADRLRIFNAQLLQPGKLIEVSGASITLTAWSLLFLFSFQWLSVVLERFPYTRPWGEQSQAYLLGVVYSLSTGVLGALPDLLVAVLIFMLARGAIGLVSPLFDRAGRHGGALGWLDADTVRKTRILFTTGVWLFAVVMVYS